jgi:hypothetical protein
MAHKIPQAAKRYKRHLARPALKNRFEGLNEHEAGSGRSIFRSMGEPFACTRS